jgi:hypothetical protein
MDRPSVIESSLLQARLLTAPAHSLDVRFCYETDDPFAVRLTIAFGDERITWTFSRDLLTVGMTAAAGRGDVIVAPAVDDSRVLIALLPPAGSAVLSIDRDAICRFLAATHLLVPEGTESDHLDIDDVLAQLLDA